MLSIKLSFSVVGLLIFVSDGLLEVDLRPDPFREVDWVCDFEEATFSTCCWQLPARPKTIYRGYSDICGQQNPSCLPLTRYLTFHTGLPMSAVRSGGTSNKPSMIPVDTGGVYPRSKQSWRFGGGKSWRSKECSKWGLRIDQHNIMNNWWLGKKQFHCATLKIKKTREWNEKRCFFFWRTPLVVVYRLVFLQCVRLTLAFVRLVPVTDEFFLEQLHEVWPKRRLKPS